MCRAGCGVTIDGGGGDDLGDCGSVIWTPLHAQLVVVSTPRGLCTAQNAVDTHYGSATSPIALVTVGDTCCVDASVARCHVYAGFTKDGGAQDHCIGVGFGLMLVVIDLDLYNVRV